MKKFLIHSKITLTLFLLALQGCHSVESKKTVAIVLPADHTALDEITAGFEETLHQKQKDIKIVVKNAHGEASLQKTIVQQLVAQKVDIIVPVGLSATQMSLHMTNDIPIVSLAAKVSDSDLQPNFTGICDELEPEVILEFASLAIPELKNLTLIHSASEKIFPDVQIFQTLCSKQNMQLQTLMIQNMSDLYPVASSINPKSQLILILKDHMVVSAIATLVQVANKLNIPLMASDDGSTKQGAAFSIGVREKQIGIEGAHLADRILNGAKPSQISYEFMKSLHLFINKEACGEQHIQTKQLEKAAAEQHFNVIYVENAPNA